MSGKGALASVPGDDAGKPMLVGVGELNQLPVKVPGSFTFARGRRRALDRAPPGALRR